VLKTCSLSQLEKNFFVGIFGFTLLVASFVMSLLRRVRALVNSHRNIVFELLRS
jgi:hypothetical protein